MILVERLDHFVLTVIDIDATVAFYQSVLGMRREIFGDDRVALKFGKQKINLHQYGREYEPKAALPTPGSADLCFIVEGQMTGVERSLRSAGVEIEEGPVLRTGATGPIDSLYCRDPDGNLIEISVYRRGDDD